MFFLKLLLYIFFVVFGGVLYIVYDYIVDDRRETFPRLISPVVHSIASFIGQDNKVLAKEVEKSLAGSEGTYAIVIKNLKTGQIYAREENRKFQSASLYKLWVMATVYDQIQKGVLKEDQSVTADISILNNKFDISSESAEMTDGSLQFTVGSALRQMITISHNYAALLLSDTVGLSNVRAFLNKHNLKEYDMEDELPETTASDTALFLEKLYNGELANKEYTQKMIDLLKNQKLNNKLPKYLPKNAVIAHKTGELDKVTHDAGIVYLKNGDYIIVVMSESDYPPGAEDRIAKISKVVYDYFSSK